MKKFFAITTLFFVAFLLAVYLTWPKYSQFASQKVKVEKTEQGLKQKQDYFDYLKDIEQKLSKQETSMDKIESALPDDPSLPSLFYFIQKQASASGLMLNNVSPGKAARASQEEQAGQLTETYLNVGVVGTLLSFENFLKAIETSSRLIEVDNLVLEEQEQGELTFNLLLRVRSY